MNRPILDNVLPTLLGPVRALLDKKADKKEVAAKLGEKADAAEVVKQLSEKANAYEIVKTVNGVEPDESGNVDVSGLPEGASPYMQLVTDSEGNAKWEERLAYTTEPVETVLMEEQEVSFQIYDGMGQCTSPVNVDLTEDTTYIVTFDGTDYECVCAALGNGLFCIGNGKVSGLEDTGEPFIYACASGKQYMWIVYDENASHTIKLSGIIRTDVTMPAKYLPVATDDTLGAVKKSDFVKAYIFPNVLVDCYEMRAAIEEFNAGKASIVWHGVHVSSASIDEESDIWLQYDDGKLSSHVRYKYSKSGNYFNMFVSSQQEADESEIYIKDHVDGNSTFRFTVSKSGIPSITDYQGSTNFWTSASVPTPTTSDTGKFLRVQADGTWGVEAVASDSGLPEGASPYMQLVTDSEGNAKWEERLAYTTREQIAHEPATIGIYNLGYATLPYEFFPGNGEEYTINWDGTDYTSTAVIITVDEEEEVIVVGNTTFFGGNKSTDIPVGIVNRSGRAMVYSNESGEHTISLTGYEQIPHKIPREYVDHNPIVGVIDSSYYNYRYLNPAKGASIAEVRQAAVEGNRDIIIRLDLDNWQGTLRYMGLTNVSTDGTNYVSALLFSTIKANNVSINDSDEAIDGTMQLEYWYALLEPTEGPPADAFVNFQFAEINLAPGTAKAGYYMRVNEDGFWEATEGPEEFSGSWNDLTEKPFGESVEDVELLPETTYTTTVDIQKVADWTEAIVVGDKYIVMFDGTVYEITATNSYLGYKTPYITGDLSNGYEYPFCIQMDLGIYVYGTPGEHTIKVVHCDETVITQIDSKFVPDNTFFVTIFRYYNAVYEVEYACYPPSFEEITNAINSGLNVVATFEDSMSANNAVRATYSLKRNSIVFWAFLSAEATTGVKSDTLINVEYFSDGTITGTTRELLTESRVNELIDAKIAAIPAAEEASF